MQSTSVPQRSRAKCVRAHKPGAARERAGKLGGEEAVSGEVDGLACVPHTMAEPAKACVWMDWRRRAMMDVVGCKKAMRGCREASRDASKKILYILVEIDFQDRRVGRSCLSFRVIVLGGNEGVTTTGDHTISDISLSLRESFNARHPAAALCPSEACNRCSPLATWLAATSSRFYRHSSPRALPQTPPH